MAADYLGPVGAVAGTLGILLIMVILIAVLGLVVVNACSAARGGTFTVGRTIPIALVMGVIMVRVRPGRVLEASLIGVGLVLCALVGGHFVNDSPALRGWFDFDKRSLAMALIGYGFIASVLPVWLLLARATISRRSSRSARSRCCGAGLLWVRPDVHLPALTTVRRRHGTGLRGPGLFPFCFITIACGAMSGFHALIGRARRRKLPDEGATRATSATARC